MSDRIAVGVDVGGTFTDAVVTGPAGTTTWKVPTTSDPHQGAIEAIDAACRQLDIEAEAIDRFGHGSTVATNALLERRGAKTALVTTEGFRDVLEIGRQDRPHLYDLAAEREAPLVPRSRRYTIAERTPPPTHPDADTIRVEPDRDELDALAATLDDVEAVAVCLLHSDVDPSHEQLVTDHLEAALDVPVIASNEIDPRVREFERTATTVASAYLTPTVRTYLDRLIVASATAGLPRPQLMQSSGGLADPSQVTTRSVTAVLSGPAAGVVGATRTVSETVAGIEAAITLDMGGTSADVGRVVETEPTVSTETTVAGRPLRVPAIDIHTVGAGGGSIGWVDAGGALRVGPASAGADPGPACYGRGGSAPTVTDAAVELGLIGSDRRLGDSIPIDAMAAETALTTIADEAGLADATAAASGMVRIAVETTAQAIRHITVERGTDPRGDTLVAFGGAGGMVASAIADRLDIETVALPPHAGVCSALGLVVADERHDTAAGVHRPLGTDGDEPLEDVFERLETEALTRCRDPDTAVLTRTAEVRYDGQSHELAVSVERPLEVAAIRERFHETHDRRHGYALDDPIEVVTARVEATVTRPTPSMTVTPTATDPVDHRRARLPPFEPATYAIYDGIPASAPGPCLLEQPNATVVVPPGWHLDATGGIPRLDAEGSP